MTTSFSDPKMNTNAVRKCSVYRIKVECVRYLTPKNYYFINNPAPPFHDLIFNPKKHWNCVPPHQCQTIWYAYCSDKTHYLIFRQLAEGASSIFLWNTPSQTTCNPHHCENLKNLEIYERSVDASCWENWLTSATLHSLPVQYLNPRDFEPLIC